MSTAKEKSPAYTAIVTRLKQLCHLLDDTFDYIKEVMPHTYKEGAKMQELRKRKAELLGEEREPAEEE